MATTEGRSACYLRVSTEGQTTENQRGEVEALARARGFEPAWFEDHESAVKSRPGFDAMMAAARRGEVQAVVVWSLDRFHRHMANCVRDVQELARLKVRLLSVREPWLDQEGPMRDLLVAIFGWMAQFERERLRERTRAGLDRARREGKRLGRPPTAPIPLHIGADMVDDGSSVRHAAVVAGVSEPALRRFLAARAARGASKTPSPEATFKAPVSGLLGPA